MSFSRIFDQIFALGFVSFSLTLCLTICVGSAFGAEEEVKKSWKNQAELTLIQTRGNSEVETFQFKDKQTNTFSETLSSELKFETLYSEALGETTAEKYLGEGRMDYKFGEKFSTALQIGWKRDKFADIDNRYYVGPILGYRFLTGPNHFLKAEVNGDYVYEEYIDETDDNFFSAGFFGLYEWVFSEELKFSQSVEVFRDFNEVESYQIESITALLAKLNSYFSLKTSYQVNHNTEPVSEDTLKTDTSLTVSLVADF